VSFGVAPSYLLYEVSFYQFGDAGTVIKRACLPLAGALRLARFNVKLSGSKTSNYFSGLPIPSTALTVFSYVFFIHLTDVIDN